MHFTHFLNLIQVHDKARLIGVVFLDALSTKYSQVVRAVEVLHPLVVSLAYQTVNAILILEIYISKNRISLHKLIQNVEIKRQLVNWLHLFDQFAANRAAYPTVMMEHIKALSAKSVSAMNKDSWYFLTHVEAVSAIVAEVKTASFIVCLNNELMIFVNFILPLLQSLFQRFLPFLAKWHVL